MANTTYGYDCGGCESRLTSIHHRKPDTTAIHLLDFIRDDVGNITKITEVPPAGGVPLVHDYTYDGCPGPGIVVLLRVARSALPSKLLC